MRGPQTPFTAAPFAALHTWQSPSLPPPQTLSQQTPSTQLPLAHSPESAQDSPFGLTVKT